MPGIASDIVLGIIIGIVVFAVLVIGAVWGYHTWWVDTHCTMVFGTQVCK